MTGNLSGIRERYEPALDNLFEGHWTIGIESRRICLIDAAIEEERKREEDLIGRPMIESHHGAEKAYLFSLLRRCTEERISCEMEKGRVFDDRAGGWFSLDMESLREGVFILCIDMGEEKETVEVFVNHEGVPEQPASRQTAEVDEVDSELESFSNNVSQILSALLRQIEGPADLLRMNCHHGSCQ